MRYKIYYYKEYLEIVDSAPIIKNLKFPPQVICKAEKLSDISEDIFNLLSEDDTEGIYYFFLDLVSLEENKNA